jgi:rhodanese-related sulfurtransferase
MADNAAMRACLPAPLSPSTSLREHRCRRLLLRAAACGLGLGLLAACDSPSAAERVALETARADHEAGRAVLIDIREPDEHATGVAAGARLLPMSQLRRRLDEIPRDPSMPVYLICRTQNRSGRVMAALRENGYGHVRYVHGGMSQWVRNGWPVVSPPR